MKNILNTLIFLISVSGFGQKYHIVYKVDFKPVLGSSNIKTEYMCLDINENKSTFYNINYKKQNSISEEASRESSSQYLRFIIKQNDKTYSYYGNFNNFLFSYNENLPLQWKIKNKVYSYKSYKVQEAEMEFEGRIWTAIFSTDVSIHHGPYKFSNLPGLILKVYSNDGDYQFEMAEIIKENENHYQLEGKYSPVKKSKIDKMIADFIKDPAVKNISIVNDHEDSYEYKFSGKKDDAYNEMNNYIKGVLAKFNNPPDKKTYILIFDI